METKIVPLGDLAVSVSLGNEINEDVNQRIRRFAANLAKAQIDGIVEWVPAYTTVTIYYEPDRIGCADLIEKLEDLTKTPGTVHTEKPIVYEIPALYGKEAGPDLAFIANYTGLSEEEIIQLHANKEYLIYMMGFMPGFPYLGGLPDEIAVPRLGIPRKSVAPGSIGIGGSQTGIYPADVPSGWRIIGITPVKLFDPETKEPFLLRAGNYIKFVPVNQEQFLKIKRLGASYRVATYTKE